MRGAIRFPVRAGTVVLLAALALGASVPCEDPMLERPNIVVVLVDDLGWSDPGYAGSTYHETPHIDALAEDSLVFTRAYAASPVCSPTRASLLTGRAPARLRFTNALTRRIYGREGDVRAADPSRSVVAPIGIVSLPADEVTIAEDLQAAGYATVLIGKWHLGPPDHDPEQHGFDEAIAWKRHGRPPSYFAPHGIGDFEDGPEGEYLTDRLTDEAVDAIERLHDQPFFLLLSHWALHTPLKAKHADMLRFRRRADPESAQRHPVYAAMLASVDESVGRVRATLEQLGIADRTVVILLSDNGAATSIPANATREFEGPGPPPPTSNAPLRSGKGALYEGGLRVPCLVHVPGTELAGARSAVPIVSSDFYPTLRELAGLPPMPEHEIDGESLAPLLRGDHAPAREALYFYSPGAVTGDERTKRGRSPGVAVVAGDRKLVHYFEGTTELFDLAADLGEQHDLAPGRADEVRELRDRALLWLERMGVDMPVANPAHVADD